MKVKVEQLDDDEDDEEEEEPQSRKLHPLAFSVFIIPVGCLLTYMIFDHELAMSGYILSICSGITGMILYFTLFLDNGDQHKDEMMREVVSTQLLR